MKKILLSLAAVAMIFAGCNKDFEDRISNLEDRVSDLEADVAELQDRVDGIRAIVDALEKNYYVTNVEEIKVENTDYVSGYRIYFNQGKDPIEIMHGNTGDTGPQGDAGKTPHIDYDTENEYWFWAYTDGTPILDLDGKKIPVYRNIDFEVVDGKLYYTVDGTSTPLEAGNVQGDSFFTGVDVNAEAGTVTIGIVGSDVPLVLPFNAAAAEEKFELQLAYNEDQVVYFGRTVELSYTYTTSDDVVVFATAPETWVATVDAQNKKILLTIGDKSGYAVVYAINNTTGEFKAKTVSFNPEEMISLGITETEFWLDPDGKKAKKIPVSTGVLYDIMGPSWLHFEEVSSRDLTHKDIMVTADPNTEAAARSYEVDFVKRGTETVLFRLKFSQKNYLEALIYDEEKQPVQWEESFALYETDTDARSGSNAIQSYKHVFTIQLSDDFTKGTYILNGAFYQNTTNGKVGARYYADLEGDQLKILKSESGYAFDAEEIYLDYNDETNEFTSSSPLKFGYNYINVDMQDGGYIGGYRFAVKVDDPAVSNNPLNAFVGGWTATYKQSGYINLTRDFTVSLFDENTLLFENMFEYRKSGMYGYEYSAGSYLGTLSADGTQITLVDAEAGGHSHYGPMSFNGISALVLAVDNAQLKISSAYNNTFTDFVATKK